MLSHCLTTVLCIFCNALSRAGQDIAEPARGDQVSAEILRLTSLHLAVEMGSSGDGFQTVFQYRVVSGMAEKKHYGELGLYNER